MDIYEAKYTPLKLVRAVEINFFSPNKESSINIWMIKNKNKNESEHEWT